jgi:hypothetical protein
MEKLTQVPEAMQRVLNEKAREAGYVTGFVQRKSKLTAELFTQTTVFGWMANPEATLEELAQTAALLGLNIKPQGLDDRFSESAAECLKRGLQSAVEQVITSSQPAIELLQRFKGVYLEDASIVRLPDELAQVWSGCGGRLAEGLNSSVKLEVRLDYLTGRLFGPSLMDGRRHESKGQLSKIALPAGSLWLVDLGYFGLNRLEQLHLDQVHFLIRVKTGTGVIDEFDQEWELGAFLRAQKSERIDIKVKLGFGKQLPCRLIAVKAPKEAVNERRWRLRDNARRKCSKASKESLALAEWTVYVTNLESEQLSIDEALVLARVRWQIELLFKLWKSHCRIDKSRSKDPWRNLCEFYAKLIGAVIKHWILITSCWHIPDRSLFKAAKTVQKFAFSLAIAFTSVKLLADLIVKIKDCISAGCRISKSKKAPANFQLLLAKALA